MSTILITGANRGIGLELVKRYAEAGHRVLGCCREPATADVLNDLAANHDNIDVHGVILADGDSIAELGKTLEGVPIDVLLNNAGTPGPPFEHQKLFDMDYDGWTETFVVNTMAPLRMLQTFHDNLKLAEEPKAITITSQMGALSLDMAVAYAYCSSKAAVNKVMRLASQELAKEGIAVGLIHPGWVQTDMGGPNAAITVDESAEGIISTIDGISLENTGCFKKWNGEPHDW